MQCSSKIIIWAMTGKPSDCIAIKYISNDLSSQFKAHIIPIHVQNTPVQCPPQKDVLLFTCATVPLTMQSFKKRLEQWTDLIVSDSIEMLFFSFCQVNTKEGCKSY